jgi:predicted membrane-bound mannosyltransferase
MDSDTLGSGKPQPARDSAGPAETPDGGSGTLAGADRSVSGDGSPKSLAHDEGTEPSETLVEWGVRYLGRSLTNFRRPHVTIGVGIVLIAALLRLWDLDTRALHHDESLHAYYSWILSEQGEYQHNPLMHGTFQFVATSLVFGLLGASDTTARLLPALIGIAVVAAPLILFRRELGVWGAAIAALLLTVSPGMLYFSRFARNDIYMVLWTLILAWSLWRFLETSKSKYVYVAAAVLAVSFATKELTYLILLVFMSYLFLRTVGDLPGIDELGSLSRIRRLMNRFAGVVRGLGQMMKTRPKAWPPAAGLLLFFFSLTLPLGAAASGMFQDRVGLILANPDPGAARADGTVPALAGPIGAPISNGPGIASRFFDGLGNASGLQVANSAALESSEAPTRSVGGLTVQAFDVASILVFGLLAGGTALGLAWGGRRWLIAAAIFWVTFAFLFTTAFDNWLGLASGIWQSLGYWIAQQDVARGGQPWYYYLVLLGTYEYLPLMVGIGTGAYLVWRRDSFGIFLTYWFLLTLAFQTYAGEKMPWLSLHLALPLILLSGRGLGTLAVGTWRGRNRFTQRQAFIRWGSLAGVGILLVTTSQSATRASFTNGDIPLEMLVYTQTSPSIAATVDEIERLAVATGQGGALPITIDTMDGFGWPFYWYLRDFSAVEYRCLGDPGTCGSSARPLSEAAPTGDVVVVNGANEHGGISELDGYGEGQRVPFRQWFPETAYRGPDYGRGLTIANIARGIIDPSAWSSIWTYWRVREPPLPIGKIDVVAYFPEDFDVAPLTSTAPGGPPPSRE